MNDFKKALSGEKQPRRRLPVEVVIAMTGRLAELQKAEECVYRGVLGEATPKQAPGAAFYPSNSTLTQQRAPELAELNEYRQKLADQDHLDQNAQAAREQARQAQDEIDPDLYQLGYRNAA